jgi:predicted RNA-binding Zn-ribbon protein involved in translation (DUF1610 family)
MAEHIEQNCPLCNTPAEYTLEDHRNAKYFSCPKCKHFVIALDAEARIKRDSTKIWRDELSRESSNLADDELLYIFVPMEKEVAGITASTAIDRKTQSRSDWRN